MTDLQASKRRDRRFPAHCVHVALRPLSSSLCAPVSPDHSSLLLHVKQFVSDLRSLSCQMADLQGNGSDRPCCPVNWLEHEDSCYWFSRSGKAWPEAEKYCQLENAHLVVVNSREEQVTRTLPTGGRELRSADSGSLE